MGWLPFITTQNDLEYLRRSWPLGITLIRWVLHLTKKQLSRFIRT